MLAEMIKGKPFLQGDTTTLQLNKIGEMFGCPKEEDLYDIPNKHVFIEKLSHLKAQSLDKVFTGMPRELIHLLSKIFVYNPKKRYTAMEIMAHPFYDELRNIETLQNGKYIVPNLFDFSKKEISMSKQKDLFRKIIPEWSEGYKNLFDENEN